MVDLRVRIYCGECFYLRCGYCKHPENMNPDNWKEPISIDKPDIINMENDCVWFKKMKWYNYFGWGMDI